MLSMEFVIIITWLVLVFGFLRKDYSIVSLASLMLMVIGTSVLIDYSKDLVMLGFGMMHIGMGFYFLVRGGTETYKGRSLTMPKFIKKSKEDKNEKERRK